MKLKIRISGILCCFVLCCMAVNGCARTYNNETVEMVTQLYHAVPNSDYQDKRSLKCEIIETDNYGRRLFSFTTSALSGYCISQKTDENYIYYYDNYSFLIGEERFKEADPEDLDVLKVENDWNKELDESKMVKRGYVNEVELKRIRKSIFDRDTVNSLMNKTLEDKNNTDYDSFFYDYSQTGQELFYIQQVYQTKEYHYEVQDEYLLILNADGTYDPDDGLMKIDDWDNINILLAEIKEKNGWVG